MNSDILMSVVTLSGIAVAVGCMLNAFGRSNKDKFDERQLIERGRGANLAMAVAMVYLLGLYAGLLLDWLPGEYATVFAVYGLVVVLMVDDFWCIFHDAYLMPEQDVWHVALTWGFVGGLWLVTALTQGRRWGTEYAWINGALALHNLSRCVMLLLRAYVLHIRDCLEEREERNGNLTERSDEA